MSTDKPLEHANPDAQHNTQEKQRSDIQVPEILPILPLRNTVVYPLTVIPLSAEQPRSLRLIDAAMQSDRLIGLVAMKDPEIPTPGPDEVYTVGTMAVIHRMLRVPDGSVRLIVQGLERIEITEWVAEEPFLKARVVPRPEILEETVEVEALSRNLVELFRRLVEMVPYLSEELVLAATNAQDARHLAYLIATSVRMEIPEAQRILEVDSVAEKLRILTKVINRELEVLELGRKIQSEAQSEMERMQREYFLREQLKAIQRELGEDEEKQIIEEYRRRIEERGMSAEAKEQALRELSRLEKMPPQAAEYSVIKTYLDWLLDIPWKEYTPDNLDIEHARRVLDEDHYDLEEIKERIIEYLAVRKLAHERRRRERAEEEAARKVIAERASEAEAAEEGKGEDQAEPTGEVPSEETRPEGETAEEPDVLSSADLEEPESQGAILCFVGPPGVGKTSLGQSIARALGRKFTRMSLGGVRDEAEIRGHRRTYIGAMPGRIIQALKRVGVKNPVFMLDEVDKIGRDFRGDPTSALLEVLDPAQNHAFRDHYLDVDFDLSKVLFIATANLTETIPPPLLDRMEVIRLDGYTEMEKLHIARGYLIPRQLETHYLRPEEIEITDDAIRRIIREYTREAGVRNLEREIARIMRKVAARIAEGQVTEKVVVTAESVPDFLGKPRFYEEVAERTAQPGVATGLFVTAFGGGILFIEATRMPGQKGLTLTGQLGEIMRESAKIALSYVRANAETLGIDPRFFDHSDIHIHVPEGAIPKDGPSAGITMVTAIVSLLTGRPVKSNVGMTGEMTLRGRVLPVGGIKQKVLAAHRAGLDTVILPKRNEPDLDELPEEVREAMCFVLVEHVDEVLREALVETPVEEEPAPASVGEDGQAEAVTEGV